MNELLPPSLERIRQQYDFDPYPKLPLEWSPKEAHHSLYLHNRLTPFYLRNQAIPPAQEVTILDAGCGSGAKTLLLAEANPGARIVGIDISERSIAIAQERLEYHGVTQAELHVMPLEQVGRLGQTFDYINCDEVLYFLDDPVRGLQELKALLKPEGILRGNFHSSLERVNIYRAQQMFRLLGLYDDNPTEIEIGVVVETMRSLREEVPLRASTWSDLFEHEGAMQQLVLMNYLIQNDRGYTIPQLFAMLRQADLELISMVDWCSWELIRLFRDPDNLPLFWELILPTLGMEERLTLYELLQPNHRLLDFWCGHPNQARPFRSVCEWEADQWERAIVHLHPQLRHGMVQQQLIQCIQTQHPFPISQSIPHTTSPLLIPAKLAVSLLPLWEGPLPFPALVHRWLQVAPTHPITLEPIPLETARTELMHLLTRLEVLLYVLLEHT